MRSHDERWRHSLWRVACQQGSPWRRPSQRLQMTRTLRLSRHRCRALRGFRVVSICNANRIGIPRFLCRPNYRQRQVLFVSDHSFRLLHGLLILQHGMAGRPHNLGVRRCDRVRCRTVACKAQSRLRKATISASSSLLRTVEQRPFGPMRASQTEARRRHFSSQRIVSVAAGQTP